MDHRIIIWKTIINLRCRENASQDEIKKVIESVIKNHPDRGGNKEEFQKINDAYQTLGSPEKTTIYAKNNPFMASSGGFPMEVEQMKFLRYFGGRGCAFWFPGGPNVQMFHNGRPVNMIVLINPFYG